MCREGMGGTERWQRGHIIWRGWNQGATQAYLGCDIAAGHAMPCHAVICDIAAGFSSTLIRPLTLCLTDPEGPAWEAGTILPPTFTNCCIFDGILGSCICNIGCCICCIGCCCCCIASCWLRPAFWKGRRSKGGGCHMHPKQHANEAAAAVALQLVHARVRAPCSLLH